MNKKLIELVEALRKAGQMDHLINCNKHCSRPPWDHCSCIASDHNAAVDAAAKALVAEIGRLPEFDCAKCARTECPHSGSCPVRPGPPHGCSSFKGGSA